MGEGDDNSLSEWLPAGWKTEVKLRKSGRKDTYYIDPSNERKFYSKPEVLRYLKNVENNHPPCEESKKGVSLVKFVDKDADSENLPAGWIKKFIVTRSGSRKDPFYIDPDSGKQFSSREEVFLHLNSRKMDNEKIDKNASNLEEYDNLRSGAGDHAITSTERRKLRSDSNKEVQSVVLENLGQLKSNKLKPCKEKQKPSGILTPVDTVKLVETPMETEKPIEFKKDIQVEKMETEKPVEFKKDIQVEKMYGQEDIHKQKDKRVDKHGDIQTVGSKDKRKIMRENDSPRRTSKRLAGVEVELASIPVLPPRVRPAATKPTDEDKTGSSMNRNYSSDNFVQKVKGREKTIDVLPKEEQGVSNPVNVKHPEQRVPDIIIQKHQAEHKADDVIVPKQAEQKTVDIIILKQAEQKATDTMLQKYHAEQKTTDIIVQKQQAEQKTTDIILPKQQAEQKAVDDIIPKQKAEEKVANVIIPKQQDKQKGANDGLQEKKGKQEMDLVSSLGGLWNDPCIEFAIKTLTGDLPVVNNKNLAKNTVDAGPSSYQESPPGGLWSDPCFEFAVKTLTGDTLPSVDATPFWSSKSGESSNVRLPNYKASAEFHQANGAYR